MVGIIGAGNMGRALALRMEKRILVSDAVRSRLSCFSKKDVVPVRDNIGLVKRSAIIVIAVKPQDIEEVLKEIRPFLKNKTLISIAAGVSTRSIEKIAGKVRVVRVMPNMPALVGKGISAISAGRFASRKDIVEARKIFLKVGEVMEIKEKLMDAVTALSGSGPAYYFLFTDILIKAGERCGLKKDLAAKLALATFIGAAYSADNSKISMQDFVKKVASKGGTTEAALKVFKKRRLEAIVKEAVAAARQRSLTLTYKRR